VPGHDPRDLLLDLDPAQREAVTITSGPLCILAGAGSGKTRVISRRVAYAIATGVVRPRDVLVVTFTDKAAGEMASRLADLGHRGVAASTFHAAALRQLRHFWPRAHGSDLPSILESKAPILAPLVSGLPGGYRYLPIRDLAAEIEWAKARRIAPADYEAVADNGHDGPLPPDLMAGLYRRYETAKTRAARIDFEDMLESTIELIDGDRSIADEVRDRYRWFSVDEFQDTNPLQAALLDAWLGDRTELAVVGDEDQTIYTFTGATSDYLIEFKTRFPDAQVVRLETNYRSTPEILGLANRILEEGRRASDERASKRPARPPKRLIPSLPTGPSPEISGFATDDAELTAMVAAVRRLVAAGTVPGAMAIVVRINAQLPAIERELGAAGIPFHVRGERFFARPEVRRAIRAASRAGSSVEPGDPLAAQLAGVFERELGVRRDAIPDGGPAAERHGAVVTLLELADGLVRTDPTADLAAFLAEVTRLTEVEAGGQAAGVELLTYHRAKGLEWDAVFLPALEEGTLPIRQATEPVEIAEERRLLYVGITRARRYLWLSWATSRVGATGREARRARSRFLDGVVPRAVNRATPRSASVRPTQTDPADRSPLSNALRAWRTARARSDAVAPFIVFHDATIEAIAERRPRTIAELRRVPGVGPTKLDRYGDEILAVVAGTS
jgi:ATP-dependent DNA helicase UvrD/PcrA